MTRRGTPLHAKIEAALDPVPFALTPEAEEALDSDLPLLGGKLVRAASHVAQARGDDAEDAVEKEHKGLAFAKLYPGARLTRRYAKRIWRDGAMRTVAAQGPDFGGGVIVGGAALWCEVEVKAIDPRVAKRLPFENITTAEADLLSACSAAGGIAVVLILYGEFLVNAKWCPVPWAVIEPAYRAWLPFARDSRVKRSPVPASLPEATILAYAVKHRVEYLQRFLTPKGQP